MTIFSCGMTKNYLKLIYKTTNIISIFSLSDILMYMYPFGGEFLFPSLRSAENNNRASRYITCRRQKTNVKFESLVSGIYDVIADI